jgi:antitoxin MazE
MQKLTRWGNSTGLRLPANVLEATGLKAGSYVSVRVLDSGDIRLRPIGRMRPANDDSGVTAESAPPAPTKW